MLLALHFFVQKPLYSLDANNFCYTLSMLDHKAYEIKATLC